MTAVDARPDHDTLVETMTGGMVRDFEGDLGAAFAGSDRLRPDGRPRGEFRAELRQIDNVRNALTSVRILATPIVVIWLVMQIDHPLAIAAAFVPIAIMQNGLNILFHEGSHRLLFSNRRINDLVGITLFGWLVFGTGTHAYRRGHANHHRDEFGPKEPDFLLYSFYPIARDSARRKLTRDAFGVSAYRILKPRITGIVTKKHFMNSARFFAMQIATFAAFALSGHPWLYLLLWVLPYFTYYQIVNRLRSVAEHGGMTRSKDRRNTTHHVRQSLLARVMFVPYGVGYHLAHHVDSGVPFRNLPRLHDALVEDGYFPASAEWQNYRTFWRSCFGG